MEKDADQAYKSIDGCVLYGTPWSTLKGSDFFYNNFGGAYQFVIGNNLTSDVLKKQLPLFKKYLKDDEYKQYETALRTSWAGLLTLDDYVYPRMFGYKDRFEYYEAITVAEHLMKIKVPTFTIGADDDQICDPAQVPHQDVQQKGSNIIIGSTTHGAHVCHMQNWFIPTSWY